MRCFKTLFVTVPLVFSISACSGDRAARQTLDAAGAEREEQAIRHVLSVSRDAWNRGDLTGYMKSYWRDERVRHVFNDDITIGYSAIEERYRSRYPDPNNMGAISGSELDVQILGPEAASAFGRWRFEHGEVVLNGVVTLVFRKIDDTWVIVHDHSTAFPQ